MARKAEVRPDGCLNFRMFRSLAQGILQGDVIYLEFSALELVAPPGPRYRQVRKAKVSILGS